MTELDRKTIFEEVYEKTGKNLNTLARRYIINREDQEDALQGLYVKFFLNLHKYDPKRGAKIETWLYNIAKNYFCDVIQNSTKYHKYFHTYDTSLMEIEAPPQTTLEDEIEKQQRVSRMWSEIDSLKVEKEKSAMKLKYADGILDMEIAKILGVSHDSARQLLTKARKKLLWKFRATA
jgi:RNA polymerase sigma factor (sigma-70 family)